MISSVRATTRNQITNLYSHTQSFIDVDVLDSIWLVTKSANPFFIIIALEALIEGDYKTPIGTSNDESYIWPGESGEREEEKERGRAKMPNYT